jgi:hypothetical protein
LPIVLLSKISLRTEFLVKRVHRPGGSEAVLFEAYPISYRIGEKRKIGMRGDFQMVLDISPRGPGLLEDLSGLQTKYVE